MPRPSIKADFIRTQPRDLPFKKLQRLATKAGVGALGKSYVSHVRSTMARTRVRAAVARVKPNGSANGNGHAFDEAVTNGDLSALPVPAAAPQPGLPASETELRFFSMLVQIGTKRAHELLKAYEGL